MKRKKIKHTPVQKYKIKEQVIFVKREDLCAKQPAPPFSKIRGIFNVLFQLKKQGITHVGYSENSISMASWGVSWACFELGLKAVIFDQQYKNPPQTLLKHRQYWEMFGAEIIPVRPGIQNISHNIGKTYMKEKFATKGQMLPIGLPFDETVKETAKEYKYTINKIQKQFKQTPNSLIVCVGSGTICSGLLYTGLHIPIYGVTCAYSNIKKKQKFIAKKSKKILDGFLKQAQLYIFEGGYQYKEKAKINAPFPCNPHYDLKAWEWLNCNIEEIPPPILFWNIGA